MSVNYRRIYSHYSFIYPNQHYRNVVVELNRENNIKRVFPFDKEIEDTEFYSGRVFFLPEGVLVSDVTIQGEAIVLSEDLFFTDTNIYAIYESKGLKL